MPDDGNRYEIIDGIPYLMAAPFEQHQAILGEIFYRLRLYLEGKRCDLRMSPYDVRLALYGEAEDEEINVVQPDIMVFCEKSKIDIKGAIAAPDIAIEILSPSSIKNDRYRKFKLYEKAGVKEYWIVDGSSKTVDVFVLEGEKFSLRELLSEEDVITSTVLEGLGIRLVDIFYS